MIVCYSNGIKIIAIVRQYCEENVLSKKINVLCEQTRELTHDFLDYV